MAEFEKDFMLRQAKDLAKGLGAFLEDDSLDELLEMDQQKQAKRELDSWIQRNPEFRESE